MQLSPTEIKIRLLKKGKTASDLARMMNVSKAVMSRVINRKPGFVYPEVKQFLAAFLGVPVSAIGREPQRQRKERSKAA